MYDASNTGLAGGESGITVILVCLRIPLGVMQKFWVMVSDVDGKVTVNVVGVTSKWSGCSKIGRSVRVPSKTGMEYLPDEFEILTPDKFPFNNDSNFIYLKSESKSSQPSNPLSQIVFPFKITTGTNFIMSYKNVFTFDSHSISVIISTLKILQELSDLTNESCYNFIEPIMNIEDEEVNYWIIIKMLLLMEDGYIRYDIDHAGYKKAFEDEKPHTHPIHHLDVFYSANTTFKLGLKSELSHDGFLDTLDINTDCLYLDCFKTK